MKGYGGLISTAWCDAHADTNGYDVLTGVVRGVETEEEGDDVTYRGTLIRKTKMDYCLVRPAPTEDQVAHCIAHLGGSARMNVEIEVYGEEGRGAWVKADSAPGSPRRSRHGVRSMHRSPTRPSWRRSIPAARVREAPPDSR